MAPTFDIPELETEEMTTDVLIELFDFGEYTEETLDLMLSDLAVGEVRDIVCCYLNDEENQWVHTIRRRS